MSLWEIILIAVGLSMDAFAVAISIGLSVRRAGFREMAIVGLYFGFFQALMPTAGYFLGLGFASKITSFDHWIAFVLLGFIGGKMIKDSFGKEESQTENRENPFGFLKMFTLAVATSIDAFAVGITFALFKVHIITSALLIGAITFGISMSGVKIGDIFGAKFKSKAEFAGGTVLVLLGIKIVIEHIFLT
jgi:putative Mn2+ efflux pump MntP